jgi:hypothetical protein
MMISPSLTHSRIARSVPIFSKLRASTIGLIHQKLIYAVCEPLQKVFSRGDVGEEMYFILCGSFTVTNATGQVTKV